MQLPTSITASPYTPANTVKPTQAQSNRNNSVSEPTATNKSSVTTDKNTQSAVPPETDKRESPQAFEAVAQSNKAENVVFEAAVSRSENKSRNPAINDYLKMAKEGMANAADQDTSLFRVDVYV